MSKYVTYWIVTVCQEGYLGLYVTWKASENNYIIFRGVCLDSSIHLATISVQS